MKKDTGSMESQANAMVDMVLGSVSSDELRTGSVGEHMVCGHAGHSADRMGSAFAGARKTNAEIRKGEGNAIPIHHF